MIFLVFLLGFASDDDHIIKIWVRLLQIVQAHRGCPFSLKCRYSFCDPKGKSGELKKTYVYFERSEWLVLEMEWDLMIRRLQINFRNKTVLSAA